MTKPKAAKTYPDTIFKQTTPDEAQNLVNGPRFNTWYKGWFTRSEIYERMMPDGLTAALRIEGPDSGGAAIVMNSKGNIKLITGKSTDVAGSGTLDINTQGSNHFIMAEQIFNIMRVAQKMKDKHLIFFVMETM